MAKTYASLNGKAVGVDAAKARVQIHAQSDHSSIPWPGAVFKMEVAMFILPLLFLRRPIFIESRI